uniref:Uncharacterized protein n=1 Tax=Cannabis sativa TaxID=3483 RepID=A0A803QUB6_CANSA
MAARDSIVLMVYCSFKEPFTPSNHHIIEALILIRPNFVQLVKGKLDFFRRYPIHVFKNVCLDEKRSPNH